MAANGASSMPGASLSDLPPLDVDTALGANGGSTRDAVAAPPFTPLGSLPGASSAALPLLIKMPDGERRQIDLPATATVRDLRAQLPDDSNWDLNFNGQTLRDDTALANYNIPDAYGHAGGLLKMITDSGDLDNTKKYEALNSACNIVATISRGETDMEKLISAALDEHDQRNAGAASAAQASPPEPQPTLREVRRGKRSFMSLNLSELPPPTLNADRGASNLPPPTPSQLISKLSAQRPDLYPPSTASRMVALDAAASSGKLEPMLGDAGAAGVPDPCPNASTSALFTMGNNSPPPLGGNGEFKRVPTNTWFSEFARHIAPFPDGQQPVPVDQRGRQDEEIGDSEDEALSRDTTKEASTAPTPSGELSSTSKAGTSEKQEGNSDSVSAGVSSSQPSGVGGAVSAGASSGVGLAVPSTTGGPAVSTSSTATGTTTGAAAGTLPPRGALTGTSGAGPSQPAGAVPKPGVPQPKKRGRKRKNPELSEEERKALRQAQNRASAKQSRMRRKVMAQEYEKRVTTLEGENETLRDTVAALSDRLQFLQNLLTVSVQKRPPGGPHL